MKLLSFLKFSSKIIKLNLSENEFFLKKLNILAKGDRGNNYSSFFPICKSLPAFFLISSDIAA